MFRVSELPLGSAYTLPSGDVPISGGVLSVGIGTKVCVIVGVAVALGVTVNVVVEDIAVDVNTCVDVGVYTKLVGEGSVLVGFGFRVCVAVGNHGIKIIVLVGFAANVAVDEAAIGTGENVIVNGGKGVSVIIDTPGVRELIHPGCVNMDASTGSMNLPGRLVR